MSFSKPIQTHLRRRPRRTSAVALASAAATALGCSASAEIPEVVVTQSDVGFEAVPQVPGLELVPSTLETSFDHPKGFGLPEYFDPELYPLSAVITARGDMQDLSFLEGIEMRLASRAEGAPPASLVAQYERSGTAPVGKSVTLETASQENVLDYWGTKAAYYDIRIWGSLPAEEWAVDVKVVFSGQLSVSSN